MNGRLHINRAGIARVAVPTLLVASPIAIAVVTLGSSGPPPLPADVGLASTISPPDPVGSGGEPDGRGLGHGNHRPRPAQPERGRALQTTGATRNGRSRGRAAAGHRTGGSAPAEAQLDPPAVAATAPVVGVSAPVTPQPRAEPREFGFER